jgi:tRNA (adenine22-N1)-methyltransferase
VIHLRPRLQAIADRVLPDRPVADLCCDHAQLAAALVESGHVPLALAIDINVAPLRAAERMLARAANPTLRERVHLRQGDGLMVVEPGEVATVVIAGVGATLAESLLEAGAANGRLLGVERVIVQANQAGFPALAPLRGTLDRLGWSLVDECLADDQRRLYVILVAEPGGAGVCDAFDHELGPILRRGHDPLWPAWVERERTRVLRACVSMGRSRAEREKLAIYRAYLEILEAT